MLATRAVLIGEVAKLHKAVLMIARTDEVTRRLMSTPGVGALTALTFKTAIDDPRRIKRSRDVGPLFGLTPRRYQSGEIDITGGISKAGDMMVRSALFEAATVLFFRLKRKSRLKDWAIDDPKVEVGEAHQPMAVGDLDLGIIDPRTKTFHRFGPGRPPWPKADKTKPKTVSDVSGL